MDTKTCNKCGAELEPTLENFAANKKNPDGLQYHCRKCQNEYRKQWRARYKEKHGVGPDRQYQIDHAEDFARWNTERVRQLAVWVDTIKEITPCADCGGRFPAVCMDFKHVRGEKFNSVCWLVQNGYSREKIQEEIDKCEIVCSNCHRIRTHKSGRERPWYDKRRKYDRSTWAD